MARSIKIEDIFWRPIRGSLILALVLIGWDAVLDGSYLLSVLICPIWFVVALIRAALGRVSAEVAIARIVIPVVTGLLVFVNAGVQYGIAKSNAVRIIEACEQYRNDTGSYPEKLDELVPQYLSAIPPAKYCCNGMSNRFFYVAGPPVPMFYWVDLSPFGCRTYSFVRHDWGYVD